MNIAVGTTWEASKLGGLNIKECLQPRKDPREKSCSRNAAGSRPSLLMGKADDTGEENRYRHPVGPAGVGDQASEEGFAEITSGRSRGQQGLVATCQDSSNEAEAEGEESPQDRRMSP